MMLVKAILSVILISSLGGQGSIEITRPLDEYVDYRTTIEGTSSAIVDSGIHVYILVWPYDGAGPCKVYEAETRYDGEWQIDVTLGDESGKRYRIIAIATQKSGINCTSGLTEMDRSPEITLTVLGQ